MTCSHPRFIEIPQWYHWFHKFQIPTLKWILFPLFYPFKAKIVFFTFPFPFLLHLCLHLPSSYFSFISKRLPFQAHPSDSGEITITITTTI
ncbi:hypothetical protein Patl1_27594 [Pistacia atlantica]|uniref:Uncharacterized protein n=1 Tax=Pistacia atlantica TaxID=434234 RepID=A0ACC1BD32_9ROSI|nr:hypothetical protein Patl1_27594 [Pistacia atlantica]